MAKKLYVITGSSYYDFKICIYLDSNPIIELFDREEVFKNYEGAKISLLKRLDLNKEKITSLITLLEGLNEKAFFNTHKGIDHA